MPFSRVYQHSAFLSQLVIKDVNSYHSTLLHGTFKGENTYIHKLFQKPSLYEKKYFFTQLDILLASSNFFFGCSINLSSWITTKIALHDFKVLKDLWPSTFWTMFLCQKHNWLREFWYYESFVAYIQCSKQHVVI